MSTTLNVVYGVCGIGNGHTHRSQPVIDALLENGAMVVVFAYGRSLDYFQRRYQDKPQVRVVPVQVPYLPGGSDGIDFSAAAATASDGTVTNLRAMAVAQQFLGRPSFVVSDYEPVAAQYAYAYDCPLYTVDQQSKFLLDAGYGDINGTTCTDERMRLGMFFPKAEGRLVCSFFRGGSAAAAQGITWCSPIIRPEVIEIARSPERTIGSDLVAYVSPQGGGGLSLDAVTLLCTVASDRTVHLFLPRGTDVVAKPDNLMLHEQGSEAFLPLLARCAGVITTAGHTLLSETMRLGIPTLAVPLSLYEQQRNAQVIHAHGFGIAATDLSQETLVRFVNNLAVYREAIARDTSVLLRGDGVIEVLQILLRDYR